MTTFISQLYKSRSVLLDLLKKRGYDIDDYDKFNTNEMRVLLNNKQLDMLLSKPNGQKVYVKYHVGTKLRPTYVFDYIDDLYNLEEVLDTNDELIIIIKDNVNDTLTKTMNNIYVKDNVFFTILTIKQLMFNILDHELVHPHRVLTSEEVDAIKKEYNISDMSQFPEISRHDPVAQALGVRPGNVVEITRSSQTAIFTKYYRLCY